ncbi:MAG: amino acid permease [Porphyromonadaceae bacterium]|nr:MAG: amino acid permease [Porphyromonadaceae bacterium]
MNGATGKTFKRSLNLIDSSAIVVGSMIGSGIFIVTADMSRTLGSPGWMLLAWLITGLMTIFAAMTYGELASMMPKAGGQYIYLREAYNPLTGFLYGWTLFTVIQTGSIAAIAMAFSKFSGVLIPWISEENILFLLGPLKVSTVHLVAVLSIILLTWINTRGIKTGKTVQNTFTLTKVLVLILFLIVGFFIAKSTGLATNSEYFWQAAKLDTVTGVATPLVGMAFIAAMGSAMVGSLFTYDAWYNVTYNSAEVINPRRTIPLSLIYGTLVAAIIFVLCNIVYVKVLPLRGIPGANTVIGQGMAFATDDRLGTAAIFGIFGEYAAIIMAALIMISTFGCNNGLVLSGARVYYAMAENKLFFKKIGNLNIKGVPANGLIIQCIWACLLCLSGSYSQLLDYVIFAVLIFYALTNAGVFVLRRKWPMEERVYKAFGYPIIPAICVILSMVIMIILLIYKPDFTWPGLIIVAIGIPVYFIWKRLSPKTPAE